MQIILKASLIKTNIKIMSWYFVCYLRKKIIDVIKSCQKYIIELKKIVFIEYLWTNFKFFFSYYVYNNSKGIDNFLIKPYNIIEEQCQN